MSKRILLIILIVAPIVCLYAEDPPALIFNDSNKTETINIEALAPEIPDGFVVVKGGTFLMGAEDEDSDEIPVHEVTLSDFLLGKVELLPTAVLMETI